MPFGFTVYPKTDQEYLEEIGNVLNSPETIVFLDTNILAHLYKLHLAARNEFYSWSAGLIGDDRLKIPAWALSEYLAKFKQGQLIEYTVKSKEPEEIKKKLENLHQIASLFVDQSILSKINYTGTRKEFLDAFEKAIDILPTFTAVFKQQFDATTIHEEIATRFSQAVLSSDIAKLCVRAGNEGEFRNSHRMPPGFKDSSKPENKNGDMIIWFEILDHSSKVKDKFSKVIILTNDEKPDWVYAPSKRFIEHRGSKKQVPNENPKIKLPDPRLVAEFNAKVGNRDLYIVSLPVFIKALSKIEPHEVKNLAEAIQVESEGAIIEQDIIENSTSEIIEETCSEDNSSIIDTADQSKESKPTESNLISSINTTYPSDALRDSAYEINPASEIDLVIRDLKSHNWYTQNPAIMMIKSLRSKDFSIGSWFVLGRNIYQAACGNSQKALEFIRNLDIELSLHDNESANHILSGMLYEVYFDSDGTFRRHIKADFVDQPFAVLSLAAFEPTKIFINKMLEPYQSKLFIIPGENKIITLSIIVSNEVDEESSASIHYLDSVNLNGVEFIQEAEEEKSWFRSGRSWDVDSIKTRLNKDLGIPESLISVEMTPKDCLEMSFRVRAGNVLNL